jgi:hypothetical protein
MSEVAGRRDNGTLIPNKEQDENESCMDWVNDGYHWLVGDQKPKGGKEIDESSYTWESVGTAVDPSSKPMSDRDLDL